MKTCPFCAEEIQDAAIVCKHCGRELPGVGAAPPQRRRWGRWIGGIVVVGGVGAFAVSLLGGYGQSGAWEACTQFVGARLKSPGSAKFPSIGDADYIGARSDGSYMVKSHVDSQNGFGAMMRSEFTCEVQHTGSGWKLTNIDLK